MGLFKKSKPKGQDSNSAGGAGIQLPPIDFKPSAFPKDEAQGVIIACRQLPGFPVAAGLLASALSGRADRILMDYSAQGVAVRFRVDGMWENMPSMDRASGDAALVVIKKMFGMNPAERRNRQTGKCAAQLKGVDWLIDCMSQGIPSGERVLISTEPKKPVIKTLSDLGMRDKMQESLKGFLNAHGGIVVLSGPAGHGLPTTWKLSIEATDKFIRDFISLENKADQDPEIINVSKTLFDTEAGELPEVVFQRRLLKQPDAFILPSFHNDKVLARVLSEIKESNRHAITRLVASDAADALCQLAQSYRSQAKELLGATIAVLNQRLIRRLCEKCRQPFQPTPQLLQKLGIPAGRVSKMYQPFIPPPPEQRVDAKGNPIQIEICTQCNGRGYFGRLGIFELLEVTDPIRNAVLKGGNVDAVRQAAQQGGHRSFQEEGILAFALGLTSLQEVQRMLQTKV